MLKNFSTENEGLRLGSERKSEHVSHDINTSGRPNIDAVRMPANKVPLVRTTPAPDIDRGPQV